MAGDWYCRVFGKVSGPFSLRELWDLKLQGKLSAKDQVRQGTSGPWTPADRLASLSSVPPGAPARTVPAGRTARPKTPACSAPAVQQGITARVRRNVTRSLSAAAAHKPRGIGTAGAPPPLPDRVRDKQIRKRILVGSGIGAGVVLLILLMLLLLLSGGGRGRETLARHGVDAGSTDGSNDGLAEGVGTHNAEGTGSEANSEPSGEAEAEDDLEGTDTMQEAAEDAGAPESPATEEPAVEESSEEDVPEEPPPPDPTFAVQELPGGSPAKGDGSAGGGRSGASGEGEFFGVKAKGRRFVYVVDCSGSMSGAPFMKACEELMDSIQQLNPQQQFYVIFFSSRSYPMFFPGPAHRNMLPATKQNIARLQEWLNDFNESGGTDPSDAMLHGLSLKPKPDAIFLLSDGAFDHRIVDTIGRQNKRKVVINTIAFINRSGEALLQRIANENRGEYRFVP